MAIDTGAYKLGAQQGTLVVTNNQRQGGSTQVTYTGNQTDIINKYLQLSYAGYNVEYTSGNDTGVHTLKATLNRDILNNPNVAPAPQVRWTIHGTAAQQHILECTDRPVIALLTSAGKEAIESQIKNPTNMATANYKGPNTSAVTQVYNLMRMGAEGRQIFFPVLKRTVTVSPDWSLNWTLTNVGKVLTKSTLLSLYNIPNVYASILPDSSAAVSDINGVTTFGGYLETYPNVEEVGDNNKLNISQEWQFNTRFAAIEYDQI